MRLVRLLGSFRNSRKEENEQQSDRKPGTMRFGVMAMAYSMLVSSVISQIVNSWPNHKLLQYGYLEQLKDILPSILLAVFMGICVSLVELLDMPLILTMLVQVMFGAEIYIIGSLVLNLDSFNYLRRKLKSMASLLRR